MTTISGQIKGSNPFDRRRPQRYTQFDLVKGGVMVYGHKMTYKLAVAYYPFLAKYIKPSIR